MTVIGAAVATLAAGYFAFISQFAQAGDFDKYRKGTEVEFGRLNQKVDAYAAQSELNFLEMRRAGIADKVYDLRARQHKLSPAERASLMRYEADLEQLTRSSRDKQRALEAMRK